MFFDIKFGFSEISIKFFVVCPILGMKKGPCIPLKEVPSMTTNCTCASGSILKPLSRTGKTDAYICQSCPPGQVIASSGKCGRCPNGKAAIPGIFIREWPSGPIFKLFKTACSGDSCSGVRFLLIYHYLFSSCQLLSSFLYRLHRYGVTTTPV